ncbi:MAG: class I SAM-dependent methyltransferase [Salinivirgaceae bacterium]|jgi:2-polyprenyl-3-methyl-5-hydroxy-6-metoxy-1,4-benzoquinol methylase|nr:class I SAM-dependent methyltransferase [Salinivirgaceae bacterium]
MKLPALNYVFEQDWILSKCVAKKVLHLGCAGDALMNLGAEASLHVKLLGIAKELCGIELNEAALSQLKEWCPASESNIYFIGNVESLEKIPIIDKFDIIVAGSIIEHLSNPGLMLEGLARYCHKDTLLLISTPHAWGLCNIYEWL